MNKLQDQFVQKLIESLKAEDGWELYANPYGDSTLLKGDKLNQIRLHGIVNGKNPEYYLVCYLGDSLINLNYEINKKILEVARPLEEKLKSAHDANQMTKALSIL